MLQRQSSCLKTRQHRYALLQSRAARPLSNFGHHGHTALPAVKVLPLMPRACNPGSLGHCRAPTMKTRHTSVVARFKEGEGNGEGEGDAPEQAQRPEDAELRTLSTLKVIGVGSRGISAIQRLVGSSQTQDADFWAIDSDKRVLAACAEMANTIDLSAADDGLLTAAELATIGGRSHSTVDEALDGKSGVVFVLGAAPGGPGSANMMLQLVRNLRQQGYFVTAALTRPFDFEGARRLEQADTLIQLMQEVAHLVMVVEQGVLLRASKDLTMATATGIADSAMEYTVKCILWALSAPELLNLSAGTFLWHGRDLRLIKRPLFPPMMNLLSCPGHGTLGRGEASLPAAALAESGLASALSTLAESAVAEAADSPFLEGKLAAATGVLCILRMTPLSVQAFHAACTSENLREHALRAAVQVAAMTVKGLVGPLCNDIIVCPQLSAELSCSSGTGRRSTNGSTSLPVSSMQALEDGAEPLQLALEASLLVIQAIEDVAVPTHASASATQRLADAQGARKNTVRAQNASGTASPSAGTASTAAARDRTASILRSNNSKPGASGVSRVPSTSTSDGSQQGKLPTPAAAARSAAVPPAGNAPSSVSSTAWQRLQAGMANKLAHETPSAAARMPTQSIPSTAQPAVVASIGKQAEAQPFSAGSAAAADVSILASFSRAPAPLGTKPHVLPQQSQQIPRMANSVATNSMVAQSLDLPPQAARWRHQQRAAARGTGQGTMYSLPSAGTAEEGSSNEVDEDGAPLSPLQRLLLKGTAGGGQPNLKHRVAGMLDREREDSDTP